MADVSLINRAVQRGFPIGTTDFNRFVESGGRAKGFPLVRSSGQGVGKTFIGGNPINPFGTDRFGRPLPSAQARNTLIDQANQANDGSQFDPELLEVTKSDPIQEAVNEALKQSRADAGSRRVALDDFNNTAQRIRQQNQAEIDRDAKETFNTDRLRDFLSRENARFESGTQALANRATQFLRRRLDEGMLAGAGAGAPIADSSDLRNRTMQAFLDINLPLQQQLSDRRINQEQGLKNLDISLAGRSQAARAALLNQLALPLQLGQQLESNDLLSLARLQAIDDANNLRGVQGNVPSDFGGLQSFPLGGVNTVPGRVSGSTPVININGAPETSGTVISPRREDNLAAFVRNLPSLGALTQPGGTVALPSIGGRRVASPAETRRIRRATRTVNPNRAGSPAGRIGSTSIIDAGGGNFFSIPVDDL